MGGLKDNRVFLGALSRCGERKVVVENCMLSASLLGSGQLQWLARPYESLRYENIA